MKETTLEKTIRRFGGLVSRRELEPHLMYGELDVALIYRRRVIRVRHGWFAAPGEDPQVLRAWRVGGRLTCVSALGYLSAGEPGPTLHVEVPANAARLRDPDAHRLRLAADAAVVVHWTRHPGPGNRRSVTAEHAAAVAAVCGTRSGGVRGCAASSGSARR